MTHHIFGENSGDVFQMEEQAGAAIAAEAGKWKIRFKSDGLYIIDDTGAEVLFGGADFFVTDGGGLNANHTGGTILLVDSAGHGFHTIAAGTVALTDNATNYIVISTGGAVFALTSGFFTTAWPVAEVVTSGGAITSITQRFIRNGQINNLYHRPDGAFPQQLWGSNNSTTLGFLDMEGGVGVGGSNAPLQIQGLNGAGLGSDVNFGGAASTSMQVLYPDGDAAKPVIAYIGDATHGQFKTATPGHGFAVGGVQVAEITASGFQLTSNIAEATGDITTTSGTDILATGMTLTPASGTYLVWFTGSGHNNSTDEALFLSVYSAGVQVAASERETRRGGAQGDVHQTFSCMARVTVNGAQAIEGRWRTTGGTATMHQRQLMIMKVN